MTHLTLVQPSILIRGATAADGPVLTRLAALDLPRTQVGGAVEGTAGVGAVLARSDAGAGSIRLSGVRLQSYGLVLDDGLRLGGLRLRAGLGDTAC